MATKAMTTLRAWALRDLDVGLEWIDAEDDVLRAAVEDERDYVRVSFSMHFSRAHSLLAHRAEEILAEHARDDRALIKRWARGDR